MRKKYPAGDALVVINAQKALIKQAIGRRAFLAAAATEESEDSVYSFLLTLKASQGIASQKITTSADSALSKLEQIILTPENARNMFIGDLYEIGFLFDASLCGYSEKKEGCSENQSWWSFELGEAEGVSESDQSLVDLEKKASLETIYMSFSAEAMIGLYVVENNLSSRLHACYQQLIVARHLNKSYPIFFADKTGNFLEYTESMLFKDLLKAKFNAADSDSYQFFSYMRPMLRKRLIYSAESIEEKTNALIVKMNEIDWKGMVSILNEDEFTQYFLQSEEVGSLALKLFEKITFSESMVNPFDDHSFLDVFEIINSAASNNQLEIIKIFHSILLELMKKNCGSYFKRLLIEESENNLTPVYLLSIAFNNAVKNGAPLVIREMSTMMRKVFESVELSVLVMLLMKRRKIDGVGEFSGFYWLVRSLERLIENNHFNLAEGVADWICQCINLSNYNDLLESIYYCRGKDKEDILSCFIKILENQKTAENPGFFNIVEQCIAEISERHDPALFLNRMETLISDFSSKALPVSSAADVLQKFQVKQGDKSIFLKELNEAISLKSNRGFSFLSREKCDHKTNVLIAIRGVMNVSRFELKFVNDFLEALKANPGYAFGFRSDRETETVQLVKRFLELYPILKEALQAKFEEVSLSVEGLKADMQPDDALLLRVLGPLAHVGSDVAPTMNL